MRPQRIKQWLRDHRITHEECARRMGYNRSSVTIALNRETLADEFIGRFGRVFGWDVVAALSTDESQIELEAEQA